MSDAENSEEPTVSDERAAAIISSASEDEAPHRARVHRVAGAIRRLIDATPGTDADVDTLDAVATALESVAADLERFETTTLHGFSETAISGDPHGYFEQSPLLGPANPLAPPLVLRATDGEHIEAVGRFGSAYEGPPGCLHGGYVAAAFDDVLGLAQSLSGQRGMTGRLTVDYRSPTPLYEELRFVGTFERVEGRKIFTRGTLHAGDRLCAEAEGLFISIDFDRFADLHARRQERRAAQAGDES